MGEKENVEPDKPKPVFDNPSPPSDDRESENQDKPDGKFYAIRTDNDQFIKANADFYTVILFMLKFKSQS